MKYQFVTNHSCTTPSLSINCVAPHQGNEEEEFTIRATAFIVACLESLQQDNALRRGLCEHPLYRGYLVMQEEKSPFIQGDILPRMQDAYSIITAKGGNLYQAWSEYARVQMNKFSQIKISTQGSVYTGNNIVKLTHDTFIEVAQKDSLHLLNTTYWDPACGTGHYPLDWYDRLFEHWYTNREQYPKILNEHEAHKWIIERCIFFSDIDRYAILLCKLGLFFKDTSVPVKELHFNCCEGDSLEKRLSKFDRNVVDYVATNPPYKVENGANVDRDIWRRFISLAFGSSRRGVGIIAPMEWIATTNDPIAKEIESKQLDLLHTYSQYAAQNECGWDAITSVALFVCHHKKSEDTTHSTRIQRHMTRISTEEFSGHTIQHHGYIGVPYSAASEGVLRKILPQTTPINITLKRGGLGNITQTDSRFVHNNGAVKAYHSISAPLKFSPKKVFVDHPGVVCVMNATTPAEGHEYHRGWIRCSLLQSGEYPGNNTIAALLTNEQEANVLMGWLNSKLCNWCYSTFTAKKHSNIEMLQDLIPWKEITEDIVLKLHQLVPLMIQNPKDTNVQAQIDSTIYCAFELTPEEIEVIESAFRRS